MTAGRPGEQPRWSEPWTRFSARTTVTPIDLATNALGKPIRVGGSPDAIAITPDGKTAYVGNSSSGTVMPIDLATNALGKPIRVFGRNPDAVMILMGRKTAYIVDGTMGTVTPVDLATNTPGRPLKVWHPPSGGLNGPEWIAIMP
jgi:YVTN family beta-propeller protein